MGLNPTAIWTHINCMELAIAQTMAKVGGMVRFGIAEIRLFGMLQM
jgi:hypothetical protein